MNETRGWHRCRYGKYVKQIGNHYFRLWRVSGGWEVSYEPVLRCGQPNIVAAKQLAHAIARKMEGEA